jgi:hypothetical protein
LRRRLRDGEAYDDAGKPSGGAYVISLLQKEFGRLAEKGNAANGAVHRLENPGKILLELIETGSYLGENDVIRI